MTERTIDWGGSNSPYETHVDRADNGRVVLAEDTTGGTVLLEYDEGAGEWIYGGPVDMAGNDVQNVGSLDAGELWSNNDIIAVGAGGFFERFGDAQTAIDTVSSNRGGVVCLPATQLDGPLTMREGVQIKGAGTNGGTLGGDTPPSVIHRADDDNGPVIDVPDGIEGWGIDGVSLTGTGPAGTATPAVSLPSAGSGSAGWRFDDVSINDWRGPAFRGDMGYQTSHGTIIIGDVDSGDSGLFAITGLGPDNRIKELIAYPTADGSGSDSDILRFNKDVAGEVELRANIGGSPGFLALADGGNFVDCDLTVPYCNYEPTTSNGTVSLISLKTSGVIRVGHLKINGFSISVDVYQAVTRSRDAGVYEIEEVELANGATLNDSIVGIGADITDPGSVRYHGTADDVNNTTGTTLTEYVTCHGDITKKASDGVGYDGGTNDSRL